MFDQWAELYDRIYATRGKDYAREVTYILNAVKPLVPQRIRPRLLDVACGTGEHLLHFQHSCDIQGLDANRAMLTVGRRKLPGVMLHCQDMTAMNLPSRFDIITCLFASIGYLPDVDTLHSAMRAMAAHLAPGGVLVIEPALTPDRLQPPREDVMHIDEHDLRLRRRTTARHLGDVLEITFGYHIEHPSGLSEFLDIHRIRLFTIKQYVAAMRDAGLNVMHDASGPTGQGLLLSQSAAET